MAQKIQELQEREARIKGMGGAKAVEKQHASGKLTARERLDLFFTPGSFRETDIFVTHRCVNFGMERIEIPADGVITGFGRVNGRVVFAFAQDFTSRAGSLGEMHSKKICKVMDLALKAGVPFVGFNDSGGARIQEGVDSLSAYGQIFYRNAVASGVEAAYKVLRKGPVNIIAQGGDGSTADIGFQNISGMFERGHNVLYICYDNEAYMNTGVQRSSFTPLGAKTTTTPMGNTTRKKNLPMLAAVHGIPFVATATGKYVFDYDFCKGCGLCIKECPCHYIQLTLEK